MKLISLTFQSLTQPNRMAMYSSIANSPQEAYDIGFKKLIEEQGDLAWRPIMQTVIDVQIEIPIPSPLSELTGNEVSKDNSNWLLNKIIDNKDTVLFDASKPYLTKYEALFIENKIK